MLPNMPEASKGGCWAPSITEKVQMQLENVITGQKQLLLPRGEQNGESTQVPRTGIPVCLTY